MVTRATIHNFKKLGSISVDLSDAVVIVGPNNSGKTSIFQALCLWEVGVRACLQAHRTGTLSVSRKVTLNRQSLVNSPIESARLLWRDQKATEESAGRTEQKPVKMQVALEGVFDRQAWECAADFCYCNEESLTCEISSGFEAVDRIFADGGGIHFGFLQAMSGISLLEDKLTPGSVDRKLGEGKTAEVLRNICYGILHPETSANDIGDSEERWKSLTSDLERMFGVQLQEPVLLKELGLIDLKYRENGAAYPISSAGRGLQQALLLLAYLYSCKNTVLLLDEPDAHLEVVRQREILSVIGIAARKNGSQLLIASHSEVVLNESVNAASVVALVENRVVTVGDTSMKRSILKSLVEIGWDKYAAARVKGHVLFLEGSTDFAMLKAFADKLGHRAKDKLALANVIYTGGNAPATAVRLFAAFQPVFPELRGLAVFDRVDEAKLSNPKLKMVCWRKRELENYFAKPDVLLKYAESLQSRHSHFTGAQLSAAMDEVVKDFTTPVCLKNLQDEWWSAAKLTDDWLDKIFPAFHKKLGLPCAASYKKNYCELIQFLNAADIDMEVAEKLDLIYEVLE
ncbi:MAG: AAA family ATPase [Prevotellaceae bacterium]|jgi:ABC-type transport system involved in cytochrome c biogenesis ATPase subunit|nr:AAA family ATPase [Prevotellaceae bacterium]